MPSECGAVMRSREPQVLFAPTVANGHPTVTGNRLPTVPETLLRQSGKVQAAADGLGRYGGGCKTKEKGVRRFRLVGETAW